MKVLACQFDIVWEDREANYDLVSSLLAANRVDPGTLIVLPELFASGFSMNVDRVAESESGPTCRFLSGLAREYSSTIVGGVATRESDGGCKNQAVVFGSDGREVGRYSKQQPFTLGGEAKDYRPGTGALQFSLGGFEAISPFVCYDLRFPELFRHAVRRGTQAFVVIANWPQARIGHWVTLLQARAIENQACVVGVNRTGVDPTLRYTGRSMIVAPGGEILADAGEMQSTIEATLSIETLADYRIRLPFLADMRTDYVPQG